MQPKKEMKEPPFFELLSWRDREEYFALREKLSGSEKRYKKNMRIESLQEELDAVKAYCLRGDGDEWRRCLVSGICWLGPQDIAVNTRQLRLLINKCKSSINGALAKMNYATIPGKNVATAALLRYIPYLQGNFMEQRQWTVRRQYYFSPHPGVYWMPQVAQVNMTPVTPQPEPTTPPSDPEPQVSDVEVVFGIPTKVKDDDEYNFITDPVCCCPVGWGKDEDDVDDFFAFA